MEFALWICQGTGHIHTQFEENNNKFIRTSLLCQEILRSQRACSKQVTTVDSADRADVHRHIMYKPKQQRVRIKLDYISSQWFYMTTCNLCAASSVDLSVNCG